MEAHEIFPKLAFSLENKKKKGEREKDRQREIHRDGERERERRGREERERRDLLLSLFVCLLFHSVSCESIWLVNCLFA